MPIVTVYTAGTACPACRMTKLHLTRRGIAYTEISISADDDVAAAIDCLGFTTAPVVLAETSCGEQSWSGYRPDRIDGLVNS